jgi:tRNA(fMet)-specific endonuclease VapC
VIVLDTDVYSLLQGGSNPESKRLAQRVLSVKSEEICVSIITFEEQTRGWLSYLAKAKNEEKRIFAYARLQGMLQDIVKLRVIAYDHEASFHYVRLTKAKVRIGTQDLKIAAIALAHAATLVTRNLQHFSKITDLKVEDWTKEKAE